MLGARGVGGRPRGDGLHVAGPIALTGTRDDEHRANIAVLIYFRPDEVERLLVELSKRFPGAEMLLDSVGPLTARTSRFHSALSRTRARYRWGAGCLRRLERLSGGIALENQIFYLDRHRERWGWAAALVRVVPWIKLELKVGHMRFEARAGGGECDVRRG